MNYPRFPSTPGELDQKVKELAELLRKKLNQDSYSIVYPDTTVWYSYKDDRNAGRTGEF